jgi:hypothetical protein
MTTEREHLEQLIKGTKAHRFHQQMAEMTGGNCPLQEFLSAANSLLDSGEYGAFGEYGVMDFDGEDCFAALILFDDETFYLFGVSQYRKALMIAKGDGSDGLQAALLKIGDELKVPRLHEMFAIDAGYIRRGDKQAAGRILH